jgi:hypothetical protein
LAWRKTRTLAVTHKSTRPSKVKRSASLSIAVAFMGIDFMRDLHDPYFS